MKRKEKLDVEFCFEFDHFAVHQRVLGGRKVEDWILFMFNERNNYDAYQPNIYGLLRILFLKSKIFRIV